MRLNKYLAQTTGLSRRAADTAVLIGRVRVNGQMPNPGDDIQPTDTVTLDGTTVGAPPAEHITMIFNKPRGYVVSRDGQGSPTIYDLLPSELHHLKAIGRLDKDSSGLLLITTDGDLAHRMTHPSFNKAKIYEVTLNRALLEADWQKIIDKQVFIGEGKPSGFALRPAADKPSGTSPRSTARDTNVVASKFTDDCLHWTVTMHEGRNRQIRRTFSALDYTVTRLHRTHFGPYQLGQIKPGTYQTTFPQVKN